jgi:hypothetical protein
MALAYGDRHHGLMIYTDKIRVKLNSAKIGKYLQRIAHASPDITMRTKTCGFATDGKRPVPTHPIVGAHTQVRP